MHLWELFVAFCAIIRISLYNKARPTPSSILITHYLKGNMQPSNFKRNMFPWEICFPYEILMHLCIEFPVVFCLSVIYDIQVLLRSIEIKPFY